MTSPPSRLMGFSSVKKLPTYSMSLLIGTPRTTFVSATPTRSGEMIEPAMIAQSQRWRQASLSRLPRYSKPMFRTISATRSTSRAR